ncbi:DNA helicase II [Legionella pneumophila]|uniref:DNA 3'-5' helicase n=1 Tax=Legionella pneumophila subsp. pascullei TaxID=91890 RepID=A0AAX2IVZ0_LEGPN|nr:DNA helicase II [Legionella pneumophila]AMP89514.1 DNA-dependent helicase II [Legionella pneumophila subsp. pascullei]AMP92820.1 DNA helicase II [Legionella pneumophila subsp. pascullei]AMP95786.1 DNA helicase II [Legionella pneumophila subsp. pascullei]SQG90701.1 DNA dependent ATPase I and helicase II [Legionella pneumophila subsp. pascullei]VEH07246.1 DNA dependent ATPase I and helicase II [Legionella pneumophila subsp. pascullei]
MTIAAILKGLNEKQREAVTSPLGNMLVLAGAGSGKTKVLVSRIAWLIEEQHLSPHAILAVTFTNKAAGEMRSRLSSMLSTPTLGLWVGTFHGLCHRLLRRHYKEANLPEQFHILDSEDQARVIKRVILSLNLDPEQWQVKQAQAFINSKKDEGLRPQHINALHYGPTKTLVSIYKAYEEVCQSSGVIDFAELLLRTHELLRDNEDILAHYRERFQAILVDEFQDTNTIQYAWIRLLAGDHTAVLAVGDDDQSIYGWRGAKVENIQQFIHDFKDTQIIRLEQNYRSTAMILNAANALIQNNSTRMGKELWTAGSEGEKILVYSAFNELDEARFITERISMELSQGASADEIAVLYRSNAQSRVLEEALLRSGIAYRIYGGVRFFDRAEIKDTLAYVRLLVNPNDDTAFERVVNFPARGIGEKTLDEVRQYARAEQCSLWDASKGILQSTGLGQRGSLALARFIDLVEKLQVVTANKELDEQISDVIQHSGLYAHFSKIKGDKSESRVDNLQELINAAKQFRYEYDEEEELPLVNSFLAHASLESGELQADEHERSVHLMTLHAAKGLEFPIVFLVGMEEGIFPGRQSVEEPGRLEEERRLCYVGMTRAMRKLVLSYAEVRRQYGREEYHRSSRFLREIPQQFLDEVRVKSRPHWPETTKSKLPVTDEASGITIGQNVQHAKFGQGVVLSIEGSGAHTRVQVKFNEHGVKWLVLAYANLTECL